MNQAVKRGVGRPRASNKQHTNPARLEILQASAELFAEFGYKGTSTRKIAEHVGIRQPSLFHHFSKKEDILTALVKEGGTSLINFINCLDYEADPAVTLYELMTFDAHFLMTEPHQIYKLMNLPEVRQGYFKTVVEQKRATVIVGYRRLIESGQKAGRFEVNDLEVTTYTVFGMGESLWSWYDRTGSANPATIAPQIADLGLRSLLLDCAELKQIKRQAKLDFLS